MYDLSNHHFKSTDFRIIDFAEKIKDFDSAIFTELHTWSVVGCEGTRDNFWTFDLIGTDESGVEEIRSVG